MGTATVAFSWRLILRILALILLIIFTFIELGDVTTKWNALALLGGGLTLWLASEL